MWYPQNYKYGFSGYCTQEYMILILYFLNYEIFFWIFDRTSVHYIVALELQLYDSDKKSAVLIVIMKYLFINEIFYMHFLT